MKNINFLIGEMFNVVSILVEIQGMREENAEKIRNGYSVYYGKQEFDKKAEEIRMISKHVKDCYGS